MNFKQKILSLFFCALLACLLEPAVAENYPLIISGKVVMSDGTPPPIRVALERYCSDGFGSAPGPLTDKNGEYLWRMNVDPMRTRACVIRATHAGYTSTSIDISALNGYLSTTITLDPIVISSPADDPYTISLSESSMPVRAKSELKAALKAMDERDYGEAANQFRKATEDAPKFAPGWHALGVVLDHRGSVKESREAFEKAIEADSKFIPAYITLVNTCSRLKDWECVIKTADGLNKASKKRSYANVCFQRAIAHYRLNDLDQAITGVQEAMRLDSTRRIPRTEYVYGRFLEAKGDLDGARTHMSKYLDLDKNAPDREQIQLHIQNLGKQAFDVPEPELSFP